MVAIPFDTLKFAEKLEAGGFTAQQARTAAEAFADATSQELATKADIALIKTDLRLEIAIAKGDVLRWVVGLALAQMGLLIGILFKMH